VFLLSLSYSLAHLKNQLWYSLFSLTPKRLEKVCLVLVCVGLMMNEVSQGWCSKISSLFLKDIMSKSVMKTYSRTLNSQPLHCLIMLVDHNRLLNDHFILKNSSKGVISLVIGKVLLENQMFFDPSLRISYFHTLYVLLYLPCFYCVYFMSGCFDLLFLTLCNHCFCSWTSCSS